MEFPIKFADNDIKSGEGGYWITPQGFVHPVTCVACHVETLRHQGQHTWHYTDAYRRGWIRIGSSFSYGYDQTELTIDWNENATPKALVAAVHVLRHPWHALRHVERMLIDTYTRKDEEPYDTGTFGWHTDRYPYGVSGHSVKVEDSQKLIDLGARFIMQTALERNARIKAAQGALTNA